jgi:Tol biopolymer transport system component
MYPVWSTDGKHLLFLGARHLSEVTSAEGFDWWVTPVGGGPARKTEACAILRRQGLREGRLSLFAPAQWFHDRALFSADSGDLTNLWQVNVSPHTAKVKGLPERLTSGTTLEKKPSASSSGDIAFASLTANLNIWSIAIDANRGKTKGAPEKLTHAAFDAHTSVSADARKLVFLSSRSGNPDVWMKDLSTGKETALTATAAHEEQPEISGDGTRVSYMVAEGRKASIYMIGVNRGVPERICDGCIRPWDWSPDGTKLLYLSPEGRPSRPDGSLALGLLDVATRQQRDYLEHPKYGLARGRFSPDGRWISFTAMRHLGFSRIMIAPFQHPPPAEDKWISITDDTTFNDKPRWSPDGNLLYFVSDRDGYRCIYARRLEASTKCPKGEAFDVYHLHSARRSLMGMGFRFLEISVSRDQLFFNLGETTGNIWMAKLEDQK